MIKDAPKYIVAKKEWGVGKGPMEAALFDGSQYEFWFNKKLPFIVIYEHYKDFCITNGLKEEDFTRFQKMLQQFGVNVAEA